MENLTKKLLVYMLKNKRFVSNTELSKVVGWRFGGKLFDLRKMGIKFEKKGKKKGDKPYTEYWKLVSIPKTLDYSGKKIKSSKKIVKQKDFGFGKLLVCTEVQGKSVEEKVLKKPFNFFPFNLWK